MNELKPFPVNIGKAPEVTNYTFEWKAVAIALVRHMHIHEGIWRVYLRFASPIGVNANIEGRMAPASLLPIDHMGLMRDKEINEMSVDAAVVNPRPEAVH